MVTNPPKPLKNPTLGMVVKTRIKNWKSRIYKRHGTIMEFIGPLGIKKSRFAHWIHGRNIPPPEYFNLIERKLSELGV